MTAAVRFSSHCPAGCIAGVWSAYTHGPGAGSPRACQACEGSGWVVAETADEIEGFCRGYAREVRLGVDVHSRRDLAEAIAPQLVAQGHRDLAIAVALLGVSEAAWDLLEDIAPAPIMVAVDPRDALTVGMTLRAIERSGAWRDDARPGAAGRVGAQLASAARAAGVG